MIASGINPVLELRVTYQRTLKFIGNIVALVILLDAAIGRHELIARAAIRFRRYPGRRIGLFAVK
jgi:hypothetical protein